jgi:glycosyl hydrolase family 123
MASAAEETVLLSGRQPWRKHYMFFPPRITVEAAKKAGLPTDPAARVKALEAGTLTGLNTPPPPADWMKPDFDDADWYLSPAREFGRGNARTRSVAPQYGRGIDNFIPEVGLVCIRGRFNVDRAKAKALKLNIVYRGGFVAWLNGNEIARGHLPDGKIVFDTGAETYGPEAFRAVGPKGNMSALHWYIHRDKKYLPNWAARERKYTGVIGPELLRDGLNVLALELHRSEFPKPVTAPKKRRRWRPNVGFAPVGLATLSLTTDGAAPKPAAPVRLQTRPIWQAVFTKETESHADPVRPIRIAAARNGRFSGQVVVRSGQPIEALTAQASVLAGPNGVVRFPAKAVEIRYAAVNPVHAAGDGHYARLVGLGAKRLDALCATPPDKAPVVAVWVTVHVPRDAPAGDYTGMLTVQAKGLDPTPVAVEVSVADWTLPDVKDFGSIFLAYQSPDTLAEYYKVPLWSEKHWAMVESSLKLLGEAGNTGLVFPLLAQSCKGNVESMVYWVPKADGTYGFDYTVFDRYLATALKYHDPKRIKVAALITYGSQIYLNRKNKVNLFKADPKTRNDAAYGAKVTMIDPKTKARSAVRIPDFGLPEGIAPWKKLLPAVCERLEQKGLGGATAIGMSEDMAPMPQYVGAIREILPKMIWFRDSHFDRTAMRYTSKGKTGTVPVGANAIVWAGIVPDPTKKRHYGWRQNPRHLILSFNRPGVSHLHLRDLNGFPRPWPFRIWMEATLAYGRNGVGRVGADYFRIRSRRNSLYNSYPGAYSRGATNLSHTTTDLLAAGPNGPVASARFENAREGFQESEARIFIEKALLAKTLSADLARRCQALLDDRTDMLRTWTRNVGKRPIGATNWLGLTRRLFDLAGEVAKVPEKTK